MAAKEIDGRNVVFFVSAKNSHGKQDATGAFIPEAKRFARFYGVPNDNVIMMDCTKKNPTVNRRTIVLNTLKNYSGSLEMVGFFGHGWPNGIQFGFQRAHAAELAKAIAKSSRNDVKVGLFACLTAENDVRDENHANIGPGTDGGFADTLRDELVRNGVRQGWVDGHKTAGHTTWNPLVVRFLCESVEDPDYGSEGGAWLVAPGSRYWKKWCNALKKNEGNLRCAFVAEEELHLKMMLDKSWKQQGPQ